MYPFTKLVTLILCCMDAPFAINITGSVAPAAITIQINKIENLESLQIFMAGFLFVTNIAYTDLIAKKLGFFQVRQK